MKDKSHSYVFFQIYLILLEIDNSIKERRGYIKRNISPSFFIRRTEIQDCNK